MFRDVPESVPLSLTMPVLRAGLCALASLPLSTGCAPVDPTVVHEYEPYDGDAFPGRREPLDPSKGGVALVTNSYSDTLSAVGVGSGEQQGDYPVGLDPVNLDGPHHVAVSPDGEAVFVALSYPLLGAPSHTAHGETRRIGVAQKLSGIDLHPLGAAQIDVDPGEIVISQDGSRVVVSHFDLQRALQNPGNIDKARAGITVLDPDDLGAASDVPVPSLPTCVAPHGMALSVPDGKTAYVACYGEDAIAIVDLEKEEVTARVVVGSGAEGFGDPVYGPYALSAAPGSGFIAVGNTVSKDLRFFDPTTGAMVPDLTLSTLGAPYSAAWFPGGERLMVPSQSPDAVAIYDIGTKLEVLRRDFSGDECRLPHAVAAVEGGFLLVCEGDHKSPGKLLRLDPETLETVFEVKVGVYADGIGILGGEAP